MPGIALVISSGGVLYASYDADFVIQGKVFQINNGITDLAASSNALINSGLMSKRLDGVNKLSSSMIIYPAKDEKARKRAGNGISVNLTSALLLGI